MSVLEDKLKLLPTNPGVYVMLNADGQIIYVGKAKNLKNRVRQYFNNGAKPEKVGAMVRNIADFYYYIVPSEIDALSLENNLIKKHKPRYNILLKDDKTYPYVKVDLREKYPTFSITRKIKKDGCRYFGPFMGGINVNGVLDIVQSVFGVRPCNKKLGDKPLKPCLNYHIGKCAAPCTLAVPEKEYSERVARAVDFLSGDTAETARILTAKMKECAEKEEFELALKYKEQLGSLEKVGLKRITSLNKFISADVIAYASNGLYSTVNILIVRNGRMLGGKNFSFETASFTDEEAIEEFITGYYSTGVEVPDEIICSKRLPDADALEKFVGERCGRTPTFVFAEKGDKRRLADMAEVNAKEHLEIAVDRIKHKDDMTVSACERLKEILNLSRYPKRMECYDISNVSGVDNVGSMVVFNDGEADRKSYRRFRIKGVTGPNDFLCHQEMMRRRLERLSTDAEKFPKPDLIIIDGGKGQLSAVKEVFDCFGITDIDLIALAERNEEIYTLFSKEPIVLDRRDYCLKLLQRIRDEAHRFAVNYFSTLHGKRNLSSVLDGVEGLGKVKKKALLARFKDLGGIASATTEELKTVDGIGDAIANLIVKRLTEEGLR